MFGSFGHMMPPMMATVAPAAAVGLQFNKSASVSLCRCLIFSIWSSPPPRRRRPRKHRLPSRAEGAHIVLNNCDDCVRHGFLHPPKAKGSHDKGERLRVPQVRGGSLPCVTSWGSTSSRGILYGSRVHTLPESILTLKFLTRF